MARFGTALVLVALMPAAAILRGTSNSLDLTLALNDMHPAQVGKLLNTVELKWEEARVSSLRNLTDEQVGLEDMVKSCTKVAKAIIAGSDGDKDKVVEYMQDVCSSDNAPDETKKCQQFASGIEGTMTDDAGFNRNELDLSKLCQAFWSGPVTEVAKVQAQKAEEEDAAKAKEEAMAEEEKNNKALASTQVEESQASKEAVNQANQAIQHATQVDEQVKGLEDAMAADANEAAKLLDTARQEEQVASEKEAKAAEAKVPTIDTDAQIETDEAKAIKEGDAKADEIAAKALGKADVAEPAQENAAAANDDAQAIAAGDDAAEKIADKALKKEAVLMAAKQTATVAKKTTTSAEKLAEARKARDALAKIFTDAPVPKKGAEPTKMAKKVEVAKKF